MYEYVFEGSLYRFDRLFASDKSKETTAVSKEQALNNIRFNFKKDYGLNSNSVLQLSGELYEYHAYYHLIYTIKNNEILDKIKIKFNAKLSQFLEKEEVKLQIKDFPTIHNLSDIHFYLYLKHKLNSIDSTKELAEILDNYNSKFESILVNNGSEESIKNNKIIVINLNKIQYEDEVYLLEHDHYTEAQENLFGKKIIIFRSVEN